MRGPKLQTVRDVSVFLARVLREVYKGTLDERRAGVLIYGANVLRGCLQVSDLEERIEQLEQAAQAGAGPTLRAAP